MEITELRQVKIPVSSFGDEDRRLRLNEEAILGLVGERRIQFAPREWKMISYLVKRKGTAVTFQELLEKVFFNPSASNNLVISYAMRINRRLADANCPQRIESVRSVGYRWM